MVEFNVIHDVGRDVKEQGETYLHCGLCLEEMPSGTSPKLWARQQLAITAGGHLQLWCVRHDCNITTMKIVPKEELNGAKRTA
jgi:hypothetical protein